VISQHDFRQNVSIFENSLKIEFKVVIKSFVKLNKLFILWLIFVPGLLFSSSKNDSLLQVYNKHHSDTIGLNALHEYARNLQYEDFDSTYKTNVLLSNLCFSNLFEKKNLTARERYINIYFLGNTYNSQSIYFMEKGDYVKSLELLEKSIQWWSSSYSNKGSAEDYLGDFAMAMDSYTKALRLNDFVKRNCDSSLLNFVLNSEAITSFNIAMIFENMGEVNKSQKQYSKALELFTALTKLKDERVVVTGFLGTSNVLTALGKIYFKKEEYSVSIGYYNRALQIINSLNLKYNNRFNTEYADILTQLGIQYKKTQNYNRALELFDKALTIRRELGNKRLISISLNNISSLYYNMGKYKESLLASAESWKLAEEAKVPQQKIKASEGMADSYEKLGNYKEALIWHKVFKEVTDSLTDQESIKNASTIEARYQSEKNENDLKLLNAEKRLAEQKIIQQKADMASFQIKMWSAIILSLMIILSALITIFAIRQRHKRILKEKLLEEEKNRLRTVIDMQEKERTRIARDLHDGIGQLLSAASINFGMLGKTSQIMESESELFSSSMKILNDACTELRSISHEMMPRSLQDAGLSTALNELVVRSFKNTSIEAEFEILGALERLPQLVENGLFRICQELIGNIIKHSGASEVIIQLYKTSNEWILRVEDNGRGIISADTENGIGIKNIKARVSVLNGSLNYENGPEKGLITSVKIPIYGQN
jgi:signal transduction histidine kinase/Tfp pilus assembly protein PilF